MSKLTIRETLALPAFEAVATRVLTEEAHLERKVDWVHASELVDIDRYLRGGELLLTAGLGFGTSEHEQRGYIRRIVAAGAAALVVEEAGRAFDTLPRAIIDQARRSDLPLIGLSGEVRFASVSAQAHEELIRREDRRREREREVESAFTQLLVDGADHFAIIQLLEEITECPVVLENFVRHVVVYRSSTRYGEDVVEAWEPHSRSEHTEGEGCVVRPVLTRGKPWGWLHVLRKGSAGDSLIEFAADRAATAIAIALLSERTLRAHREQRSAALVTRLLLGDLGGEAFVERARRLGFDLSNGPLIVLVLNSADQSLTDTVTEFPFILAGMGEYLLAVLPEREFGRDAVRKLIETVGQGGGVSRAVGADRLPNAVEQAQSAAAVARGQGVTGVLHFDELGIERVLVLLGQGPELANFVEDELGPVLNWDASSANPLMPTLRAFLEADGNKSDAAEALFVQRRTLYNRLDRISALLGRSIDEVDTRQRIHLAVKGLDLLRSAPGSASGSAPGGRIGTRPH